MSNSVRLDYEENSTWECESLRPLAKLTLNYSWARDHYSSPVPWPSLHDSHSVLTFDLEHIYILFILNHCSCWEEFAPPPLLRQHLSAVVHHNDRRRLQNSLAWSEYGTSEATNLGHCWPGASHISMLPIRPFDHSLSVPSAHHFTDMF